MYELFIIFILTLSTIIFGTLFIIYYNNVDKYMKDKELDILKRETEVIKKEEVIKKYESCKNELDSAKSIVDKIKELIKLI